MDVIYALMSILAALLLFLLRRRRPFFYGLLECAVGQLGLMLTFHPQTTYLLSGEASPSGLILSRGIAVVGGIYLLVRGMDNMERDLPRRWRSHFASVSQSPKRDGQVGR